MAKNKYYEHLNYSLLRYKIRTYYEPRTIKRLNVFSEWRNNYRVPHVGLSSIGGL